MGGPAIPISGCTGVVWPAIPKRPESVLFSVLRQLEQSEWWPPETLLAQQLRQVERILAHAAATVPFYAERLKVLGNLKPGGLTLDAFRRIPILGRTDIQEAGESLASRKIPADHGAAFEIKTSGSTGRPITVKGTSVTGLMLRVSNLRYHLWHKRDLSGTTACIRMLKGRQLQAAAAGKPVPWADGYPSGPMYLRHVATPISEQLEWLAAINPDYLLTFPSNLLALIRLSRKKGVRLPKLREVATLGEAFDPAAREACETHWGVPVADAYSSQEFGLIAVQCPDDPERRYHMMGETILAEILNAKGEPCAPGESGRMVLTALHNFATPLIRYEIGDVAQACAPCGCGRGLMTVAQILGRTRNMLVLPSGEQICPRFNFEEFLFEFPIRQFQVIQESLETLAVRLVADRKLSPDEEEKIQQTLVAGARHPFRVRIEYLPEIPRAASGKFEEFRSEVSV
jgi:phenylacetate-CoA ligase